MAQEAWFRFLTTQGTILGLVRVPSTVPTWFQSHLKELSSARELTMADVDPETWVDALSCELRPIPVLKPLSPSQQEEHVYFPEDGWKKMNLALAKAKSDNVPLESLMNPQFARSHGMKTHEEFHMLPPEKREGYMPIPRAKLFREARVRHMIQYTPMLDADDSSVALDLYPFQIVGRTTVRATAQWQQIVEAAYGPSLQVANQVPPTISPRV